MRSTPYRNVRVTLLRAWSPGVSLVLTLVGVRALACVCDSPPPMSPTDELASHSLVFVGTMVRVDHAPRPRSAGCGSDGEATDVGVFDVVDAYKGTANREMRVALVGSDCSANLTIGSMYLIFTDVESPLIGACSLVLPLDAASQYVYCEPNSARSRTTSQSPCAAGYHLVSYSGAETLALLDAARSGT